MHLKCRVWLSIEGRSLVWGIVIGELVLEFHICCGIQEIGAVGGFVDNKSFDCTEEQVAQIDDVPGAPALLVLGMEAV